MKNHAASIFCGCDDLRSSDKQMGLVCHVVLKMVWITMYIASGGRFKERDFDPNSFEPLGSLIGIYSCVITGA
jgi:hypothetical protein